MSQAFAYCREALNIRVVLLTGAGDKAFCAGGDMHVKGRGGYVGGDGVPRLNVLTYKCKFAVCLKPVISDGKWLRLSVADTCSTLCAT